MARTRNNELHALKRDAVLDAAEHLIPVYGWEHLSIQQIIAEVGISKGAFYHYFSSKSALLSALLNRRLNQWEHLLNQVTERTGGADTRLRELLRQFAAAKSGDRAFFIQTLQSLYADENVAIYVRSRSGAAERISPIIEQILVDGHREGVFNVDNPTATARVVMSLLQECADSIGRLLLAVSEGQATGNEVEHAAAAYELALHRCLAAAPGSLDFIDAEELRRWVADIQPANNSEP